MAAFETPWTVMPDSSPAQSHLDGTTASPAAPPHHPPTIAAFTPVSASPASKSTFQVHQKSPLLVATPPRVTQALSKAYPWVQAANWIMGLLTWTSADPWESFLVVAAFWATALYAGALLRYAGNVLAVALLIAGMFLRRYRSAPTSTTLDEILNTLTTLNTRVELFFDPFLTLLNVLSTQKTATSATTRPALTSLFVRILLVTPLWLALAVWPLRVITARRIVLFAGTLLLSWHSRPAKVSRTILWRSETLRTLSELLTGLSLTPSMAPPPLPQRTNGAPPLTRADTLSTPHRPTTASASPGVKFTFAVYENQRRWLGIGWTPSIGYERAAWTDEHLNACAPPHEFTLPATEPGSGVVWRWVPGEDWEIEGATPAAKDGAHHAKRQDAKDRLGGSGESGEGWWYYDNRWRDGRRGVDGWGKYTRRRKWTRRAELIEAAEADEPATTPDTTAAPPHPEPVKSPSPPPLPKRTTPPPPPYPPRYSEHQEHQAERIEEDERADTSSDDNDEDFAVRGRGRPQIRVVDVDEDGRETVLVEDGEMGRSSSSGSSGRGVERKPVPPPLPQRRPSQGSVNGA